MCLFNASLVRVHLNIRHSTKVKDALTTVSLCLQVKKHQTMFDNVYLGRCAVGEMFPKSNCFVCHVNTAALDQPPVFLFSKQHACLALTDVLPHQSSSPLSGSALTSTHYRLEQVWSRITDPQWSRQQG